MTTPPPSGSGEEPTPLDQLIDLFVYAPVGLLYEYDDVLPQLVKRGKSQVQLAKVLGQMAVKKGPAGVADTAAKSVPGPLGEFVSALAQGVTEFGTLIGLAPAAPERSTTEAPSAASVRSTSPAPLPIAGYDDLTAKEIVPLLDDLTPQQRDRVRSHETDGRGRRTILGKLDRLDR